MPYGLPKNIGGDSKENVKWMEECVRSVMRKNEDLSKESAIRICKEKLIEVRGNKKQANILLNRMKREENE